MITEKEEMKYFYILWVSLAISVGGVYLLHFANPQIEMAAIFKDFGFWVFFGSLYLGLNALVDWIKK